MTVMAEKDVLNFLIDDAVVDQEQQSSKMRQEEAKPSCFELEGETVEEIMTSSLDINKVLGVFPSMSTDEKIKQFQIFLTAIMKNDLVCQINQVQYLLMLHYFVMALCSRSTAQDLAEAEKQIRTIEKITKEKPECQTFLYVVYHTLGCLCYKQNRFEDAMQWFQKSKQEFEENPPNIEWINVILKAEEIQPENFEVKINEYVEKCTDPPDPIATCQHLNCQGYFKKEIYPSDPDYKGYVELSCDNNCSMQYHTTCWKKLKYTHYHGQSNQNFCSMSCLNGHCKGTIIKFMIHTVAGTTQTEFEVKIPDVTPKLSAVKKEPEEMNVPEESSKYHELNEIEMAKDELYSICPTGKCRLFQEITQNRKLIENAISEIENLSELLIECNLKEELAEKSNKNTAESIVDHVLEWNCNFKMRHFLSQLINRDISNHPELLEWLTFILKLSDQYSLYFLLIYKKTIIQILNEADNLIINIAKKLLSRKAISQQEIKILTATAPDQRPYLLMEQVTNKKLCQIEDLVFLLAEEQDAIPKLKPLFENVNQEFDTFGKGSVPNFGSALTMDSFSKDMDYSLFYRLLHLLIIKGTEVVLKIFDRAIPPQILKRELLKNKRILEPYHKSASKAMVNTGEWSLLFPPNNEQPNSQRFDITLLASLIRHLKILPSPRRGWNAEPSINDHSKSAAILHLCNLRNKLLFETLNSGIKESDFAVMWDRITEILVNLGADKQELQELKSFPVEKLWEDHHRLAGYLGKPVADVMQMLLSFVQQEMTTESKEATAPSTNTDVLSVLPPPQEMKEKIMETGDLIEDDQSVALKGKTKSKKKKSKSKKAGKNEDHRTTQATVPKKHETMSILVQEIQSNESEGGERMANPISNASTFGVIPSGLLSVLHCTTDASHAAPSLTSHEVNKLADLSDLTNQSVGELDDDGVLIDEEFNADLCSSPLGAEGASNAHEHNQQTSKEVSDIKQKLIDRENENKVLKKISQHLTLQFRSEQQQRINTETLNSKLQEHYQQEMSRLKQQLQRKEEEIKKITTQFASERSLWNKDKAKLEDVTAKNIAKLVEATKRAVAAEVLFLECQRDNCLFKLQQAEQDCTVQFKAAEENLVRNPASASACARVDGWQAIVADIRNKIDFTKNQFSEQIGLLKNGTKLSMLPQIKIPPPPEHPDAVIKHFLEQHLQTKANLLQFGSGHHNSANGPSAVFTGQPEASVSGQEQIQGTILESNQVAAWHTVHTGGAVTETAKGGGIRGKNSFERIMEKLSTNYPQFTRSSLMDYLKIVRLSNGGSLSGLSYDEIVNKVAQLLESKLSKSSNRDQNKIPPPSVWQKCRQQGFKHWEGATTLSEEDPCVICHEELAAESMFILPCAHKFHSQCIGPWLKDQRTCPTCRLHVVLPQEFPDLPNEITFTETSPQSTGETLAASMG